MKKTPILLLSAMILFNACGSLEGSYITLPPLSKKKKKQKIHPSIAFSDAIKRYRKERGFFPQTMQSFEYYSDYTRNAMQSMRDLGFADLTVSWLYLDSLVIDFSHKPIYTQKVNNSDFSIDLAGQLIYTKKGDSFVEYRVFDKRKGKIDYTTY